MGVAEQRATVTWLYHKRRRRLLGAEQVQCEACLRTGPYSSMTMRVWCAKCETEFPQVMRRTRELYPELFK